MSSPIWLSAEVTSAIEEESGARRRVPGAGRGRQGGEQGAAASRRKLLILTHGACGCQNWDGGFLGFLSCGVGWLGLFLPVLWRASTSRRTDTGEQEREKERNLEPAGSPLSLTRSLTEERSTTHTPTPSPPTSLALAAGPAVADDRLLPPSHVNWHVKFSLPLSRSGICHGDGRRLPLPSWRR